MLSMKVSLAMIVKDDEHYLSQILPIIRPHFDAAVAVDAGSIDGTRRILRKHGFKVVDRPWTNHYADARNEALKHATGDWVVMLDADEAMLPAGIERLKNKYMAESKTGFVILPRYNFIWDHDHYNEQSFPDTQGRALRLGMGYHYRNPVHEIVYKGAEGRAASEMGYGVQADGCDIFHYGSCKPREETWLRHHNYDRIRKGEQLLRVPPKQIPVPPPRNYPVFQGAHPMKGLPIKPLKVRAWDVIEKAEPVEGWMSVDELLWLARASSSAEVTVEVGSWKGRSTKALAGWTAGRVFAADHWRGTEAERYGPHKEATLDGDLVMDAFRKNLAPELAAGKVVPVRGDHAEVWKDVRVLVPNGADLVFLDGDHSYGGVKRDIENFWPLVRPGGVLAGHDYSTAFGGVMQAVHERFKVHHHFDSIWYVVRELV